ncbi:MAG TPA: hypothetical protein PK024_08335 [Methanospirillum sp.]|uniref:hypothetical protein n=1 Tax=Methanospirillum sp. TaxID=45200 RepID=UPI002CC56E48|nr:hypothetical protein [Methanospirillum sp.]HOJ96824.1 hypothetical protein [Methanospirillum sp.]HOL41799.1 hypothetical protein [Methanospirillum sp.]
MRLILPDLTEHQITVHGRTIEEILVEMNIDPLTTLLSRENEIIPEDTVPDDDDSIRIIQISHGG